MKFSPVLLLLLLVFSSCKPSLQQCSEPKVVRGEMGRLDRHCYFLLLSDYNDQCFNSVHFMEELSLWLAKLPDPHSVKTVVFCKEEKFENYGDNDYEYLMLESYILKVNLEIDSVIRAKGIRIYDEDGKFDKYMEINSIVL